jgi:hypothetical protein
MYVWKARRTASVGFTNRFGPRNTSQPPEIRRSWLTLVRFFFITVGKTLAYTSIRFTNEQEELVARGSHTK